MDEVGLEKTIILSGNTRAKFDATVAKYGKHSKRFAVWCGIDYPVSINPISVRRQCRTGAMPQGRRHRCGRTERFHHVRGRVSA